MAESVLRSKLLSEANMDTPLQKVGLQLNLISNLTLSNYYLKERKHGQSTTSETL